MFVWHPCFSTTKDETDEAKINVDMEKYEAFTRGFVGKVREMMTEKENETPIIPMPIKATPYQHQVRAYNFALRLFGIGGTA